MSAGPYRPLLLCNSLGLSLCFDCHFNRHYPNVVRKPRCAPRLLLHPTGVSAERTMGSGNGCHDWSKTTPPQLLPNAPQVSVGPAPQREEGTGVLLAPFAGPGGGKSLSSNVVMWGRHHQKIHTRLLGFPLTRPIKMPRQFSDCEH